MGILTRLEESISHKIGALILAGATFSPALRSASAAEGMAPVERPVATRVSDVEAPRDSQLLSRPYGIVRGDSELAQVWTRETHVYVDKEVLEKGVDPTTFGKLAETLKERFPNWTIYVTTPGSIIEQDPDNWQDAIQERLTNIVDNQLQRLSRFTSSHDQRTGMEDQSILVLCYGQGDLPTVLSWAYPGSSYQYHGLDQDYWKSKIVPELARELAQKGTLNSAISNAITSFEEALDQRVNAARAELTAEKEKLKVESVNQREQIETSLVGIAARIKEKVPNFDPAGLKVHRDTIAEIFKKIDDAIENGRIEEVRLEIDSAQKLVSTLQDRAENLPKALAATRSGFSELEGVNEKWFLDEPGHEAISNFENEIKGLHSRVVSLQIDYGKAHEVVGAEMGKLKSIITNDQTNEVLGCMVGGVAVVVTAIGAGYLATEVIPRKFNERQWARRSRELAESDLRSRHKAVTEDLRRVGNSLTEKRNILGNMYQSVNADILPEVEGIAGQDSPASRYRAAVKQADKVLQKMEEIHAWAEKIAEKPNQMEIDRARAMIRTSKVSIEDGDQLDFLKIVKDWKQEILASNPHEFKRPETNFEELNTIFTELIGQARKAMKEI